MFGFITPSKPELGEAERARYDEVYCGVCHALGRRLGQISRTTLNNDMTFVALLLMSMYEPRGTSHSSACPAHPIKKRAWCENECIDYAADMTLVLAYFKLLDDWRDDKNVIARVGARVLRGKYERVSRDWGRQCEAIERGMNEIARAESEQAKIYCEQKKLEQQTTNEQQNQILTSQVATQREHRACEQTHDLDPDIVANMFGAVMAELLVIREDFWSEQLRVFGAHFGRFIYMMDAAFDLEDDKKHDNYNPFLQSGFSSTEIEDVLLMYAGNMASAFEKLPCVQDVNILRNVLYSGIWIKYNAKFHKDDRVDTANNPANKCSANKQTRR